MLPEGTGAPTPVLPPPPGSTCLAPTAHLGLPLSCEAGAQDIHRVHGKGGCASRQAAAYEVCGEFVRFIQVDSVEQFS